MHLSKTVYLISGYYCKCAPLFMGTHCDVSVNPCASNPCLYGGTCIPVSDDFICQCRGQYTGQRYVCMFFCANEPFTTQNINVTPSLFFFNVFPTSSLHFETRWSWLMSAPILQPWIPLYLILFTQLTVRQWLFCCYWFFSSFEGASWVHIAKTILVKTVASALTVWMDLFVSVKQAFGEKGE